MSAIPDPLLLLLMLLLRRYAGEFGGNWGWRDKERKKGGQLDVAKYWMGWVKKVVWVAKGWSGGLGGGNSRLWCIG